MFLMQPVSSGMGALRCVSIVKTEGGPRDSPATDDQLRLGSTR